MPSSCQPVLFIFLCLVGVVLASTKTTLVECPEVNVVQDFNLTAYLGLWYEIAHGTQEFQPASACVTAQYGTQEHSTYPVSVLNRKLNEGTATYHWLTGNAILTDPSGTEGKLKFIFDLTPCRPPSDYWVLATDYTNFALVYTSCQEIAADKVARSSRILSRTPEIAVEGLAAVEAAIAQNDLDRDSYKVTRQDGTCDYNTSL